MKSVLFKPWIGKQYGQDGSVFSQKILVLGDSHYIDEADIVESDGQSCDFTTGVIHDYLDQDIKGRWKATFTKFMNSFVHGSEHAECSRDELWNSVAFYNYLQIPAGSSSRQTQYFSYTENKDRSAFLEVIEDLEPDIIISWGNKVWGVIPENIGYGNGTAHEVFDKFCYIYPFKGKTLRLVGVTHPSTSYNSYYWANVFSELAVNA